MEYHDSGEYQPLSWYRTHGYEAERIKVKCDGTYEHPVLGLCYKVLTRGSKKSTAKEDTEEHWFNTNGGNQLKRKSAAATDAAEPKKTYAKGHSPSKVHTLAKNTIKRVQEPLSCNKRDETAPKTMLCRPGANLSARDATRCWSV